MGLDAGTAIAGGLLGVLLAGWAGALWGWDEATIRWRAGMPAHDRPDWTGT